MAADPFFAAGIRWTALQPNIQRNMAGLKHGTDLDRELALAGATPIQADPATLDGGNTILAATFRANRTGRPKAAF